MTNWKDSTPEEEEAWAMMEKEQQYEQEKKARGNMYWNNRLVRVDELFVEVQEVFYNSKDEPCGYCDPCLGGDSVEEAKQVYDRIAEAFTKPVLDSKTDFDHDFDRGEDDGKEEA